MPEEIFRSAKVKCCWILGGSFEISTLSDEFLPRDADAVSRSALGYIRCMPENALIIIPLINDNNRKIAYMLNKMGRNVYAFDFPSRIGNMRSEFERLISNLIYIVEKHTKNKIKNSNISAAKNICDNAKIALQKFNSISENYIKCELRILIAQSYYYTDNINEWSENISALADKIKLCGINDIAQMPKVLIVGSPIYFPNIKIPRLCGQSGLNVSYNIDCTSLAQLPSEQADEKFSLKNYAEEFFRNDVFGAYSDNIGLREKVSDYIDSRAVDGVIIHILKGQIEYDFELDYLEKIISERNIPVIRLETDYNKQDIEQLRIRIEAFAEIINQKNRERSTV